MSKQEVERLIEDLVNAYSERFNEFTPHQLQACAAALIRLMEECGPSKALVITDVLLGELNFTHQNAWDWLIAELYFEAYAVALDDRTEAAIHFLKHRPDINGQALDRYNAQIERFKE